MKQLSETSPLKLTLFMYHYSAISKIIYVSGQPVDLVAFNEPWMGRRLLAGLRLVVISFQLGI